MLIESLLQKQAESNLNDRQFAEKIGMSRGYWNRIRRGKAGVGEKLIQGTLGNYPDLAPDVLHQLRIWNGEA